MLRRSLVALAVPLSLALAAGSSDAQVSRLLGGTPRPVVGDTASVLFHYERWKAGHEGGARAPLELPLGWSRGRSVAFTRARGSAVVDPGGATIDVSVAGLEDEALGGATALALWLVSWAPEGRETPAPIALGTFAIEDGAGALQLPIDAGLATLELEELVLTRAGTTPGTGGVLFGAPDLLQRLAGLAAAGTRPLRGREVGGLPLAPPGVPAQIWTVAGLDELVADGERLFFEETFDGNGRTCGTCHPAENNFTIDPTFIARLPDDDPLFVAETVPALDSRRNGGLVFESPTHMRRFGLIVENLDGFEDLVRGFVLRAVQPTLALAATVEPQASLNQPLRHLTGWGGDGAPGRGSLREFAIGAVTQHFPRTLGRRPGVDFRLPTTRELSALEAFQLSLGRREDPDLGHLQLRDADARQGLQLFVFQGLCNACHQNGGGRTISGLSDPNAAFVGTGVEALEQASLDGTGLERPVDGGFGTQVDGGFTSLEPRPEGGFGNGRFNAPSLVEFADTLPAFHSHLSANPGSGLANTVEGAVDFYRTQAFVDSDVGGGFLVLELDDLDVARIGRFLRVLSALENVRVVSEYVERARDELEGRPARDTEARLQRLLALARADGEDARQVLGEVGLHPGVVNALADVEARLRRVANGLDRRAELDRVLARLGAARVAMVVD